MSFSPLFYVDSVFCMCVVCLLSFVDFNKIFYPKKVPYPISLWHLISGVRQNYPVLFVVINRLVNRHAL